MESQDCPFTPTAIAEALARHKAPSGVAWDKSLRRGSELRALQDHFPWPPTKDPVRHPNSQDKSKRIPSQYQPPISSVDVSREDNYLKILSKFWVLPVNEYD